MSRKYWKNWDSIAAGAAVKELEAQGHKLEDMGEIEVRDVKSKLTPAEAKSVFEGADKEAHEPVDLNPNSPSTLQKLSAFADAELPRATEKDIEAWKNGDRSGIEKIVAEGRAQAFAQTIVASGRLSVKGGKLGLKAIIYPIKMTGRGIGIVAKKYVSHNDANAPRLSPRALEKFEPDDPELQVRLRELEEVKADPDKLRQLAIDIRAHERSRILIRSGRKVRDSLAFTHDFMNELVKNHTPQKVRDSYPVRITLNDEKGTSVEFNVTLTDPASSIAIFAETIKPQAIATIPVLPFSGLVSCHIWSVKLQRLAKTARAEGRPVTAQALERSAKQLSNVKWLALGAHAADLAYGALLGNEASQIEKLRSAPIAKVEPPKEDEIEDDRPTPKSKFGRAMRSTQDFFARLEDAWETVHDKRHVQAQSKILAKTDKRQTEFAIADAAEEMVKSVLIATDEQTRALAGAPDAKALMDDAEKQLGVAREAAAVTGTLIDALEHPEPSVTVGALKVEADKHKLTRKPRSDAIKNLDQAANDASSKP